MMFSMRKPSGEQIQEFLAAQAKLDFSYAAVGATATQPPSGYVMDHTRIKLGDGERDFQAAKTALERWEEFRLGWLEALPSDTPIQVGQVVAVLARPLGLWWLNACRIVYIVEEDGRVCRFGFAYGTLPDHVGSGEERFLLEWDQAENGVWYDILAFSRPRHLLARFGYPYMRRVQKQFGPASAAAMVQAVARLK
jgi:uncharacterized protein (UPF0548 family)